MGFDSTERHGAAAHGQAITVGIDLGQKSDPTAIVAAEESRQLSGAPSTWTARDLSRLPLHTPYPEVASRVASVVERLQSRGIQQIRVIADATGVGIPVVELIREALKPTGVPVVAATFTYGRNLNMHDPLHWTVGKAFLVGRLQALLQSGRIKLPPGDTPARQKEIKALVSELEHYEIRVSEEARDTYGAFKVGTHDDLVTALGLAILLDTVVPEAPIAVGSRPILNEWERVRGILHGQPSANDPDFWRRDLPSYQKGRR